MSYLLAYYFLYTYEVLQFSPEWFGASHLILSSTPVGPFYKRISVGIAIWTGNYIHGFIWDIFTNPCHNFTVFFTKPPLKLDMEEWLHPTVYMNILFILLPHTLIEIIISFIIRGRSILTKDFRMLQRINMPLWVSIHALIHLFMCKEFAEMRPL